VLIRRRMRSGSGSWNSYFTKPLVSNRFAFYIGTPEFAAARVRFAGFRQQAERFRPIPGRSRWLWTCPVARSSTALAAGCVFRIRQMASMVIRTDLYLTGVPFPGPK